MRAASNGIEVEYGTIGEPAGRPLVLIAGLGNQLVSWHPDFCQLLAGRGFFVIRFDNRDAGLSSKIEDREYALADMANDLAGLLDHLAIASAHIVGISMGGMIAQRFALDHRARTLSLTSIASTTGARDVGGATPEAGGRLGRSPAPTPEERIAASIEGSRIIWGDTEQFPFDEAYARWRAETAEGRMPYPDGTPRQLRAIRADGDRTDALRSLDLPTVVIHGSNDPLIRATGGEATAAAIPGARHVVIEGMGHVVDPRAWVQIVDEIKRVASAAVPSKP